MREGKVHCCASCVQMCEAPLLLQHTQRGTGASLFNAFWPWGEGPGFWTQLWYGLIKEWSLFTLFLSLSF